MSIKEDRDEHATQQNESVDNTAYDRMCNEMRKQLQATKINENVVKKLMEATFSQRRKWIYNEDFMSITKIVDEFPALMDPKWVCKINPFLLATAF